MAAMPSTTAADASSSSQYTYPATTAFYFPTPFHLQQTPPPPVPYIGAAPPPAITSVSLPIYPAPPPIYSLLQYQQAQRLFQRDAQTITPEALESVKAALASSEIEQKQRLRERRFLGKLLGRLGRIPLLQSGLKVYHLG